jgi:DNA-binding GntR family transcriptional regulator
MASDSEMAFATIAQSINRAPSPQGGRSYIEVGNLIGELIESGALATGSRLPSERDLHELLGVARGTLRDALTLLEAEGTIHRLDRRGWFVSPPRIRYDPTTLEGFHTFIAAQGRTPSTHTISKQLLPVNAEVAGVFGLERNDPIYLIVRRRCIDGRPVLLEHIYVDPQRFPQLIEHDLDGSLSAILRDQYKILTTQAQVTMYPSILTGPIAQELNVSQGTPSLFISRICRSAGGLVTEYNQNFWHYNTLKLVMHVRKAAPERD